MIFSAGQATTSVVICWTVCSSMADTLESCCETGLAMMAVGTVGVAGGDAMGVVTLVTVAACQSRRSPHAGQALRLSLQSLPQLRHVQDLDEIGSERCGTAEASGVHAIA